MDRTLLLTTAAVWHWFGVTPTDVLRSGGSYGPEGGLVDMIVVTCLAAPLWYVRWVRPRKQAVSPAAAC